MRCRRVVVVLGLAGWLGICARGKAGDHPVYELRIYTASPGKLGALQARFREHTTRLFEKHGMTNIGYFIPADEQHGRDSTLIYLLRHSSPAAAEASWQAFREDPDWKAVKAASESDGVPLAAKVESIFSDPVDYSPDLNAVRDKIGACVYELRTYRASPGKLPDLHARFREHTTKLFEKHGMINVLYATPRRPDQGRDDTLIYLLAFPSREAARQAWKAFGEDPEWKAVKAASEPDGVPLAAKVESLFLEPTDYSPLK
jgi:hypothetical protein